MMITRSKEFLAKQAKALRRQILKMAYEGKGSHISSSLSIADILIVLYYCCLKINTADASNPNRDKFILSKGHAASALYAILAQKGFINKSLLKTYGKENTLLGAHPEHGNIPGVELSTGSLGHGLSVATGMALAAKLNNNNAKAYALLSDGECEEGSVWETALFASHHKLDNLVAIIDYNKLQAFGRTNKVINLEPLSEKWKAFGWTPVEIDGHNLKTLQKVLTSIPPKKNKPTAIIAHTIAGKGVSFIENRLKWHYLNLTKEQYEKAISLQKS